ncbi:hypothetical protein COV16_06430, partial [Candidatus Woesearchaeota archaeon CG10_big_fil_rev_8_21_14_0_10_34_8]
VPTEIGVFERENLRKGVVYVGRVPDNYVPPAIPHNSIATYPLFDKILGYKIMVSLPFSDTMIEIFNDCQNYVRLANS